MKSNNHKYNTVLAVVICSTCTVVNHAKKGLPVVIQQEKYLWTSFDIYCNYLLVIIIVIRYNMLVIIVIDIIVLSDLCAVMCYVLASLW